MIQNAEILNKTQSSTNKKLSTTIQSVENRMLVNTSILVLCMALRAVAYAVAVAVGMKVSSFYHIYTVHSLSNYRFIRSN